MANASRDTTDKVWKISADLGTVTNADVTKTVKLATAGTYVDENIWVSATAKAPEAATLGASATGSATITSATVGTKANGAYPITGSADISGTASATTTKAGYAASSLTGSGSTTGTANLDASIPAAAATVTFGATAASPTIALDTATATKSTAKVGTITTTKPGSGAYVAVKATAPKTTLSATTKSVTTAGYLGDAAEITASAATTAKTGSTYYVPVTAGSLANSATNGTTYAENTTVSIPSEGALYINEGYYPATMITLDQILDGKADTAGVGTDDVISGAVVYDVDGKKLTGTMKNAIVVGGDISHTIGTPAYNSTTGVFDMSCDITTAAPTVSQTGFISPTVGTKTASTAVSENHTLAKVALQTSKTSGNLTVAPTLARTAKPSGDAWVDAASGAATTTKPTSADPYVQIDAAAATNAIKIKPSVKTAGYGDTTNYDYTEGSYTVGAAKATTRYIPITKGSASVTADTIATTISDPTYNSGTGKYDLSVSGSKTIGGTATAGWVSSVTGATVGTSGSKSLNAAVLTHANTATETKVAVGASGTRSSNLAAPGSDTTYYITINASQTAAGSVTHSASVSEGYVPSAGLSTSATIPTSASVSGNGDKVYLKSTVITGSVAASLAGATTGYNAPTTVAASTTIPQLKMTGNGSATSGAVYTGTANADNKYINYYTGSYTVS